MATKLCSVKAIGYIEVDEPILDKVLKCNCDEREARALTPMTNQENRARCDCVAVAAEMMNPCTTAGRYATSLAVVCYHMGECGSAGRTLCRCV